MFVVFQKCDRMNMIDDMNDEALLQEVGRRIAFLRRSSQIKQEELAEKAGISRYALSRLENGAGGIRLESFLSVLRSLNVLNRLSVVLPEPTLTPIQLVELGKKSEEALPKRIRTRRSSSNRVWGDGTSVA